MSWFGGVCNCGRFQLILAIGEFAVLLWEASLSCAMSYISQYGSFCDLPFPFNEVRSPDIGRHSVLLLECWCWSWSDTESCSVSRGGKGRWTCGGHSGKEGSRGRRMHSSLSLGVCVHQPFSHHCFWHSLPKLTQVSSCSLAGKLVSWLWDQKPLCSQWGLSNCVRAGPGETVSSWASDAIS